MALAPCKECGTEVSTKAATCPKCGNPISVPKKKTSGCAVVGAVLFALVTIGWVMITIEDHDGTSKPASSKLLIDKSPAKQREREKLIAELEGLGVVGKVDCRRGVADAWVKSGFYALPFDRKKDFTSVVYAYCFNDENAVVHLKDHFSGKDVGTYGVYTGLEIE